MLKLSALAVLILFQVPAQKSRSLSAVEYPFQDHAILSLQLEGLAVSQAERALADAPDSPRRCAYLREALQLVS